MREKTCGLKALPAPSSASTSLSLSPVSGGLPIIISWPTCCLVSICAHVQTPSSTYASLQLSPHNTDRFVCMYT